MALRWCHEADGAVAMLVVVPIGQLGDLEVDKEAQSICFQRFLISMPP
jgi:hypothetical protein